MESELFLADWFKVSVQEGNQPAYVPRIFPNGRFVVLSPEERQEFWDAKSECIGSMERWLDFEDCDEIGFDKKTGVFRYLMFKFPETTQEPLHLDRLMMPSVNGSARFVFMEEGFCLRPFAYRFYDPYRSRLFCFGDRFLASDDRLEMKLTPEISLYFDDQLFSGWSLHHPELYLADISWEFSHQQQNDHLKNVFQELMDLTSEENIELMDEEKDPQLLERLKNCYDQVKNREGDGYKILGPWILDLMGIFYGDLEQEY